MADPETPKAAPDAVAPDEAPEPVWDHASYHYNIPRLHMWFTVVSLGLLATVGWMVVDDYEREWKVYQREFASLRVAQTLAAQASIETEDFTAREADLSAAVEAAQASLDARGDELETLDEQISVAFGEWQNADMDMKFAKAEFVSYRYDIEGAIHRAEVDGDVDAVAQQRARLASLEADMGSARAVYEEVDARHRALTSERAVMTADLDTATSALSAATRERDRLAALAVSMERAGPMALLDAPMLDFIQPSLKVQKQVLPHLPVNLNFVTADRIDMCTTCHIAADKGGFEDGAQPLVSHPRLDLFLKDGTPHPLSATGCTVCHDGRGEGLSFQTTSHTPANGEVWEDWHHDYGFHPDHYWDLPMLPLDRVESSCYQCHEGQIDLIADDAPRLAEGAYLVERMGCWSCHDIKGFQDGLMRVGPDLATIASKTSADWIAGWLRDPRQFRPSTRMPSFFHLSNYQDEGGAERQDVTVAAITSFLTGVSEMPSLDPVPVGDAVHGAELFEVVGCQGCHTAAGGVTDADFGPALDGVASKVAPEYLYAWIRDPVAFNAETRMPSLRLTEQEAADIVAHLTSDPVFTAIPDGFEPGVPEVDGDLLADMALTVLQSSLTAEEAQSVVADQQAAGTLLPYFGEKMISQSGCFSCHNIPGFENAQKIGTELTEWASKDVTKLDFSFLEPGVVVERDKGEITHSRWEWLQEKIKDPRVFDHGREKPDHERLRMPLFNLDADQQDAIATFVLGLKKNLVTEQGRANLNPEKQALADGLAAIRRANCQGCHVFEEEALAFTGSDGHPRLLTGRVFVDEDEEEIWISLWRDAQGFGGVSQNAFVEDLDYEDHGEAILDGAGPYVAAWGGELFPAIERAYAKGVGGLSAAGDKARSFAPPVLADQGRKTQTAWLFEFLKGPWSLRPWLMARMPTFGFTDAQAKTIVDGLTAMAIRDYPRRLLGAVQVERDMSFEDVARASGLHVDTVARIASGGLASDVAREKLLAMCADLGVDPDALIGPAPALGGFGLVDERRREYLAAHGQRMNAGRDLFENEDIACLKCHIRGAVLPEGSPEGWGPDLEMASRRLQPDWIRRWITDPQQVLPGTKMPTLFPEGTEVFQDIYAAPRPEQVGAIKDHLLNLDRKTSN